MSHTDNNQDKIFYAVMYCIMGHLLLAIMSLCVKYIADNHTVYEAAFYRSVLIAVTIMTFFVLSKKTCLLKPNNTHMVTIGGIMAVISMLATYSALSYLPMAYATVIFFTSAIITPVLSFLFLKEHIGIHRWGAIFLGLCGVIIIAQPSGEISMWGLIFGLAAASLQASMYTVLRGLKAESPLTVNFYFAFAGVVMLGAFIPFVATPVNFDELIAFVMIAFGGGMGQYFLTKAYKYAPASLITPFGYSALLWALIFDIFYWKYDLDMKSILTGTGIILCAQLYILYREYLKKKKSKAALPVNTIL